MQREFEVHNFAENVVPRSYEAVYTLDDDHMLIKTIVHQRQERVQGGKPLLRWRAAALAWTPGQSSDSDYTHLCSLSAHEMAVREVIPVEATEEVWLEAARADAAALMSHAQVFCRILQASETKRSKLTRGVR